MSNRKQESNHQIDSESYQGKVKFLSKEIVNLRLFMMVFALAIVCINLYYINNIRNFDSHISVLMETYSQSLKTLSRKIYYSKEEVDRKRTSFVFQGSKIPVDEYYRFSLIDKFRGDVDNLKKLGGRLKISMETFSLGIPIKSKTKHIDYFHKHAHVLAMGTDGHGCSALDSGLYYFILKGSETPDITKIDGILMCSKD